MLVFLPKNNPITDMIITCNSINNSIYSDMTVKADYNNNSVKETPPDILIRISNLVFDEISSNLDDDEEIFQNNQTKTILLRIEKKVVKTI